MHITVTFVLLLLGHVAALARSV